MRNMPPRKKAIQGLIRSLMSEIFTVVHSAQFYDTSHPSYCGTVRHASSVGPFCGMASPYRQVLSYSPDHPANSDVADNKSQRCPGYHPHTSGPAVEREHLDH